MKTFFLLEMGNNHDAAHWRTLHRNFPDAFDKLLKEDSNLRFKLREGSIRYYGSNAMWASITELEVERIGND